MRVGLFGAGGIGRVHAQAYAEIEGARLVAVADIDRAAADKLAAQHGAQAYYDCQHLLGNAEIDMVDVCLPTYCHEWAVLAAAGAQKHVLCEKPMALDLASAERMLAAVEGAGVRAMMAQVVRFTPQYVVIRDLLQRGELGRPLTAAATRLAGPPRWSSWFRDPQLSGGAVLDLHIHDLDFLFSLFGRPLRVYAVGQTSAYGAWDHVLTTLDFGQVKATAEASFLMPAGYPFTATFRLLGEEGCAQFPFGAQSAVDPQAAAMSPDDVALYRLGEAPIPLPFVRRNPYLIEIEYFVRCLQRDEAPQVATFAEARTVLEIALAAKASLESGQAVTL